MVIFFTNRKTEVGRLTPDIEENGKLKSDGLCKDLAFCFLFSVFCFPTSDFCFLTSVFLKNQIFTLYEAETFPLDILLSLFCNIRRRKGEILSVNIIP